MKVLKNYLLFTSYLIAITPLLYLVDLESSYVFTQTTWMRIIALSQLCPLVVLWLYDEDARPRMNLITSVLVLHLLVLCTVNFFSLDVRNSFLGEWRRFGGVFDWFALYVFFFSLITVVSGREQWRRYSCYLVGISILVSLFGLAQASNLFGLYFFDTRVFSTLGNPAFLASYLMLASGFAFYSFFRTRGLGRLYYASAILIQMVVIYLTETSTVIIGYALAMIAGMSYFGIRRLSDRHFFSWLTRSIDLRRDSAAVIIAAIVFFTAVGFVAVQSTAYLADARKMDVASDRLIVWKIAVAGFAARPLTGWGTNNFYIPFQRYFDPTLYRGIGQTTFFDKAHNEFINRLAEEGIPGFLTHALVIVLPLLFMGRRRYAQTDIRAVALFTVGYFIYLLFFFHSIADSLYFFMVLALFYSYDDKNVDEKTKIVPVSLAWAAVAIGVMLSVSIHARDVAANYLAKAAGRSNGVTALERNAVAWSLSPRGHRTILNNLASPEDTQGAAPVATLLFYGQFIQMIREYISESPLDAQYVLLFSRILREVSYGNPLDIEYALNINSLAIELSPRYPIAYLTRGLTRIELARYATTQVDESQLRELGLTDLRTALQLSPNAPHSALNAIVRFESTRNRDELRAFLASQPEALSVQDWRVLIQYLTLIDEVDELRYIRSLFAVQLIQYRYSGQFIEQIDWALASSSRL